MNINKLVMKLYFLSTLILLSSISVVAQSINWVTMNEALELQKNAPKKIMIDMYTSWCGPCKMLDKNTFTNKDLISFVNSHYYTRYSDQNKHVGGEEYTASTFLFFIGFFVSKKQSIASSQGFEITTVSI